MKKQETREEESDELEETETEELDVHHEDFDDTEQGSMTETFKRSFEAWYVAECTLKEDPRRFGAQSFGLIALSMVLEIHHSLSK